VVQQGRFDGFRATRMIQDKAQSAVALFSCLPVSMAQNTTWLGMSFTRAATPYWIIRVAPFGRVVKRSSAVLRLLARTRRANIVQRARSVARVRIVTRRDAPSGQPLHNSLNPSNLPCWTTNRQAAISLPMTQVYRCNSPPMNGQCVWPGRRALFPGHIR